MSIDITDIFDKARREFTGNKQPTREHPMLEDVSSLCLELLEYALHDAGMASVIRTNDKKTVLAQYDNPGYGVTLAIDFATWMKDGIEVDIRTASKGTSRNLDRLKVNKDSFEADMSRLLEKISKHALENNPNSLWGVSAPQP
ncbi:MAG: hypothetical protein ACLFR0_02900 [Alphaproteobacteria bacterium]